MLNGFDGRKGFAAGDCVLSTIATNETNWVYLVEGDLSTAL